MNRVGEASMLSSDTQKLNVRFSHIMETNRSSCLKEMVIHDLRSLLDHLSIWMDSVITVHAREPSGDIEPYVVSIAITFGVYVWTKKHEGLLVDLDWELLEKIDTYG